MQLSALSLLGLIESWPQWPLLVVLIMFRASDVSVGKDPLNEVPRQCVFACAHNACHSVSIIGVETRKASHIDPDDGYRAGLQNGGSRAREDGAFIGRGSLISHLIGLIKSVSIAFLVF
jgi:hypothetical protein